MERRTVAEVMTSEVVRVGFATPFKDIASLLAEYRISGVPVVGPDDRVAGVISETDLMTYQARLSEADEAGHGPALRRARRALRSLVRGRAGAVRAAKQRARTAERLMSAPAITVHPQAGLAEAARTMVRHGIERLPVVDDDNRLVGIVTRRDLLQIFLRTDHEIRTEVIRGVLERTLGLTPAAVHVTVHDGAVTLEGRVERASEAAIALRLSARVDGVIAVVDRLTFRFDDSRERPEPAPAPNSPHDLA
ncbi:CBS domain-containing protein [Streptomyces sp. RB6PN25]|uniref:CBS domain-containing protein n=1 Tax=Streptomyces humicola TaxID=2953240 RepID=A0ABT1PWK3_9ACTN|nr:CBS domain-containing protein [Streptomyces humicola]MCQ4082061.1 CBS domain-containing protein [Streptomyces humicola]